jgi:hypothetical protein
MSLMDNQRGGCYGSGPGMRLFKIPSAIASSNVPSALYSRDSALRRWAVWGMAWPRMQHFTGFGDVGFSDGWQRPTRIAGFLGGLSPSLSKSILLTISKVN